MAENNQDLEEFRRQWREEVYGRAKKLPVSGHQNNEATTGRIRDLKPPREHPALLASEAEAPEVVPETQVGALVSSHSEALDERLGSLSLTSGDEDLFHREPQSEPSTALEHFEQAVEKEAQGNLGDSLSLYRKAYKLDSKVDQTYRRKHFSQPLALPIPEVAPINPFASLSGTSDLSPYEHIVLTPDLIASFSNLAVPVADPIIENTPPPPCPISKTPSEILVEILRHLALLDPASFGRLSLVCKRLAYHVACEQNIWKRVCQGGEFGFASMHYSFACTVDGRYHLDSVIPPYNPFPLDLPNIQIPNPLTSWSQVFQTFPRIRFTGIYISTVNYARPGAHSAMQNLSWSSPVHIVTYYRYLRFYPDGTLISLLSTTEPMDVVPHISQENLNMLQTGASAHPRHHYLSTPASGASSGPAAAVANPIPPAATSALKGALRGRWRLSKPSSSSLSSNGTFDTVATVGNFGPSLPPPSKFNSTSSEISDPRDLFVETEGVDPKYIYAMHLALRSTGNATGVGSTPSSNTSKNTKLVWRGFWSYNRLTDDWAEFGLRNDKAFVFRRVRGWGMP